MDASECMATNDGPESKNGDGRRTLFCFFFLTQRFYDRTEEKQNRAWGVWEAGLQHEAFNVKMKTWGQNHLALSRSVQRSA